VSCNTVSRSTQLACTEKCLSSIHLTADESTCSIHQKSENNFAGLSTSRVDIIARYDGKSTSQLHMLHTTRSTVCVHSENLSATHRSRRHHRAASGENSILHASLTCQSASESILTKVFETHLNLTFARSLARELYSFSTISRVEADVVIVSWKYRHYHYMLFKNSRDVEQFAILPTQMDSTSGSFTCPATWLAIVQAGWHAPSVGRSLYLGLFKQTRQCLHCRVANN